MNWFDWTVWLFFSAEYLVSTGDLQAPILTTYSGVYRYPARGAACPSDLFYTLYNGWTGGRWGREIGQLAIERWGEQRKGQNLCTQELSPVIWVNTSYLFLSYFYSENVLQQRDDLQPWPDWSKFSLDYTKVITYILGEIVQELILGVIVKTQCKKN